MPGRRKRDLSPDERAVWDGVARSVTPLAREAPRAPEPSQPEPEPAPSAAQSEPAPAPVTPFRVGDRAHSDPPAHDLAPTIAERLSQAPSRLDARRQARLKRGKLTPEARIDLHGITLAQAQPALTQFVHRAHGQGKRLVLVITGKGREDRGDSIIPAPRGALRHQVPVWLQSGSLARLVLEVTPAHFRHGGEGAYYVYLRRRG